MYLKKPYLKNAKITCPWGPRVRPITMEKQFHAGIDIALSELTKLYAPLNGIAKIGFDRGGYGNWVEIFSTTEQGVKVMFLFAHLFKAEVKDGESVIQDQLIAESGNTGFSTGPHLHFGVYINNGPKRADVHTFRDNQGNEFWPDDPRKYFNMGSF